MRVVAIDQGTTSTRAFVQDGSGSGRIVCTRTHQQRYPCPGWVEHDPEQLLDHVQQCLEAAAPADAIGIGNQGESCLAWDRKTGAAISPVIVWQDRRTEKTTERLKSQGAEDLTMARAGLPLDPYFSAAKLAWIVENLPQAGDLLAKGRLCLGTTDAFFLHRLTGRFVTDITTASRTSLLNLDTGQWDADLCALFGVPSEALPEILPTMGDFGCIRVQGREVPVTASVVDQQAALFGHGCRHSGDAKITFGTGAFALAVTGSTRPRQAGGGLLPTVAWQQTAQPPVYALDGGVYCASSAVNWAKSLGLFSQFTDINAFDAAPAIERNLAFVPALTGLACPYWDSSAAGLWLGLSLDTTAPDMMQALLEGIAFRAGQVIDAMSAEITLGGAISIDGGMSSNPYFCQFLADVLQKQIRVQANTEATALGVAQMAAGDAYRAVEPVAAARVFQPQAAREDGKQLFAKALARARDWSR
jgi:glycerol kinase